MKLERHTTSMQFPSSLLVDPQGKIVARDLRSEALGEKLKRNLWLLSKTSNLQIEHTKIKGSVDNTYYFIGSLCFLQNKYK